MSSSAKPKAVQRKNPDVWLKPGVMLGSLVPLVSILVRAVRGTLGANPIAEALNELGLLALIFLIASLAPTPLKLLADLKWPLRIRRMLGLLAFFYASLHLLTYALLDRAGELATLLEDLGKRPFVTVGFLAWLMLVPLAITSTKGMVKRLGFARWKLLHKLSYVAAAFGVVHFLWRVKKDTTEPVTYGLILALLLGVRVLEWHQARQRARYAS
ncbi:MAG: Membrane protein YedZ [Myxococcaceae bacterium]|nr:Membrane protein YedZ [Myxococcaceae bacterium]